MAIFRLPVIFLVLCSIVGVIEGCSDSSECQNGGTCEASDCKCAPGYTGTSCETEGVCSDGGNECINGGTCVTSPTPTTCTCAEGYTGNICDTDINECEAAGDDANECDTNAACTNTPPGSYTCTCNEGFAGNGKTCTEGVCSVGGNECINGGTCVTSTTPTTCTCAEGYTGDTCQNDGDTVKISTYLMTMTVFTFFVIL